MTAVLLFAKAPRSGKVKTRLAATIGAERALAVYRQLGRAVADAVAPDFPLTVWYDPPNAKDEMRRWLGDHEFLPQSRGDLGSRLTHAFSAHFSRGDHPVLAIGADAPGVDGAVIGEAVQALVAADAVIGPATDGGYYLIGLARDAPASFREIPWSTGQVTRVTLDRLAAADLSFVTLKTRRDVDTADDLAALGIALP